MEITTNGHGELKSEIDEEGTLGKFVRKNSKKQKVGRNHSGSQP